MSDPGPITFKPANALTKRRHLPGWCKWLLAIGVAFLLFRITIPTSSRCGPVSVRTLCGTNLNAIARSCLLYAEANRGVLPPNLDVLLLGGERAYLSPKQIVCPMSKLPYSY